MKIIYISICLWALAWVQASAFAAAGEVVYKAKCSTCHDSGAGLAPRLSVAAEWTAREARGPIRATIQCHVECVTEEFARV